jgi:hypothetical protein
MMYAFGETVTRLRGTPVLDPYSQTETTLTWDTPESLFIEGCAVYPSSVGGLAETVDVGRDQAEERLTVLMPTGTDVTRQDRLVIRGNTYDVDGFPHDYHHPITGWNPGLAVAAVRKVG